MLVAKLRNKILSFQDAPGEIFLSSERLSAVCYAPPPCISESLANAMLNDNLVLSLVNGLDIVPRFSKVCLID
jgi:hypothetical protein